MTDQRVARRVLHEQDQESFRTLQRLRQVERGLSRALDDSYRAEPISEAQIHKIERGGPRESLGREPLGRCISTEEIDDVLADIDQRVRTLGEVLSPGTPREAARRPASPLSVPVERLSLGWVRVEYEVREIVRGSVQAARDVPVAPSLTARVAFFLIAIKDFDDLLDRENHGHWGWHYHYCNWKEERSDTILCFDFDSAQPSKPLFAEKHAERNAKFPARPNAWKQDKRASIYDACEPDLRRWPQGPFKKPGKGALLVWP